MIPNKKLNINKKYNIYDVLPIVGVKRSKISSKSDTIICDDETWFDDYFTIKNIDENTIAIGEPRYWQRNYSYLILGDKYALLFDCGTGYEDISEVVKSLTSLPIILMISHYHFDHVGNIDKFDNIWLGYNQIERQVLLIDNRIKPTRKSHLGIVEGLKSKEFGFNKILCDSEFIDIGGLEIQVLYAGGHDPESIVLYDRTNNRLFAGDYLMKGAIITHNFVMPTASLEDYKKSIKNIYKSIKANTDICIAHPLTLNEKNLKGHDVYDLYITLSKIEKNNVIPKKKIVNNNLYIIY